MVDYGVVEDLQTIDWDNLLDSIPDDLTFDLFDQVDGFSTSPDSAGSFSLEDIEQYLLNDADDDDGGCLTVQVDKDPNVGGVVLPDGVAFDLSPESGSDNCKDTPSPETLTDEEGGKDGDKAVRDGEDVLNKPEVNKPAVDVVDDDDDDSEENDPAVKKRKRQMRNRDAAVRSRERKKVYVKDLEIKSKYYEAECRRLGILLQCCMAENQALRLSLHSTKVYDASMTKQESAVLFLELLLLGSLLGSLGILIYLLLLPSQLLLSLEPALRLRGAVSLKLGRVVALREARRSKVCRAISVRWNMIKGKRCKASRSRIKLLSLFPNEIIA